MRPDQPTYYSPVLDHLGLVAGMCDALGMGEVIDHAPHHNPERRDLTVGEAVTAMGLHGVGVDPSSPLPHPQVVPEYAH
jgi:hypothetical protein